MKKILCFILIVAILFSFCSCGKKKEVDEKVYDAVSVACDAYFENVNILSMKLSYSYTKILYNINNITESDDGKSYIVDITWYVNFLDSGIARSYWNEHWFKELRGALSNVEIDGHSISHTNEFREDLICVVVNNGEPYTGVEYAEDKNR